MSATDNLLADAEKACLWCDSYSRMECVFAWHPWANHSGPKLRNLNQWFRLLGQEWSSCDNLWEWSDVLRWKLQIANRRQLNLMMTPEDRAQLQALPETLTVWRGCHEVNVNGLSWSLDRSVAERFPTLYRYRHNSPPVLLKGSVEKRHAVLLTDRNESEIVSPWVQVIEQTDLRVAAAA